jgi:hypothetical protein
MSDELGTIRFIPIDRDLHAPTEACLRYMNAHGYDPQMPVFRALVPPEMIMSFKAARPEIANIVTLLVGPFGIVAPGADQDRFPEVFRVAEMQIADNVLDVEAEYEWQDES